MQQWPAPDGAFREREGAFESVEDRRRADVFGSARQLVAAVRAARGVDQARALQLLEQLADGGGGDVGALGERAGVLQARPVRGQGGQDDRRVVREFADPKHLVYPARAFRGPF